MKLDKRSIMICDMEREKYYHFDCSENSRNESLAHNIAAQVCFFTIIIIIN